MEDYLKAVAPYFHSELISSEAICRLRALAALLPPFSDAIIECRLGTNQPQVDFSIFPSRDNVNLLTKFVSNSTWQALQIFFNEWNKPESRLFQVSNRFLALEFDLDRAYAVMPTPCIFLELNQALSGQDLIDIALKLPIFPVSKTLKSNLRRFSNSLPKEARVKHIGAMLSRLGNPIRLTIAGLSLQQLPTFLMKVGCIKTADMLRSFNLFLSSICNYADNILLTDFDIGEIIYPKVGLEYYFSRKRCQFQREPLLDYLVDVSLCSQMKKNALLSWTGMFQRASPLDLWPQSLNWGDLFLKSKAHSVIWRDINHLKLVHTLGGSTEAKAYLSFGHHWINRSKLSDRR